MKLTQGFRMAFKSVLSNKLRTVLSMLGILIGVATVIALVAMGEGSSKRVEAQVASLGTNMLSVTITGRGTDTTLSKEEAMAFADLPNVAGVSPVVSSTASVKFEKTSTSVTVEGITPEYEFVNDFSVQTGRYIAPVDEMNAQKVALIGVTTADDLFGSDDPLGKIVLIDGMRFTIVGLLESKGSSLTGSNDEKILIPLAAAQRLFKTVGVRTIYMKVTDMDLMDRVMALLEVQLTEKFRGATNSYRIFNQADAMKTLNSVNDTMSTMLVGVAAISLVVGGIGIMNIMLVSVTERTREIGIRKSLGAKRRDILFQFLVEAVTISALGGILGILLGYAASIVIGKVMATETSVSTDMVLASFVFSALVGIVFGIFPANKAAGLKPVDALRHD
ncbi:putative ABC transport system permease protein [Paenibacillus castaneae]|uniref:ABC transporter permease n=2 Tax=Paenibacillus TaxID=44249 RepID=UPI000C99B53A|nr:ABC transporter permease [Paenibacillus castaneae]NIK79377.1 putative ABC transport system permease protein [Paenibacillus castaneae]